MHTDTCTHADIHMHTHKHTHICMHTSTCACTFTFTHTHTHTHCWVQLLSKRKVYLNQTPWHNTAHTHGKKRLEEGEEGTKDWTCNTADARNGKSASHTSHWSWQNTLTATQLVSLRSWTNSMIRQEVAKLIPNYYILEWFCLMPVHTCVAECTWNVGLWGASCFGGCTCGGVYVPCI